MECLPRYLVEVEIEPISGIEVISESKGEYKATSNAPRFDLKFVSTAYTEGWYYLEAALMRHSGSRDTNIHVYVGGGENKHIVIPIPTNLRGTVREVFYLPKNVTALSWRPTAAPGFFSQSPLLIHKVSPFESILRRLSRVLFDYWRFRNKAPILQVVLSWLSALGNLQNAYQHTATLRFQRLENVDYSMPIELNDLLRKADVRDAKRRVSQLPSRPIISLIMLVQGSQDKFFRAALDSVLEQIYPHWELLLVGGFVEDATSHTIANEYQRKNAQVKIIPVVSEADLATALNRVLELAQGEFVVRLHQHDLIPAHALFFLAQELCNYPDADLIYSDDVNLSDANKSIETRFKPDWNSELFLSNNYLANLTLYRHKRAIELGGYRTGFVGAEDFDFFLRYLKDVPATKIRHIPKVLCYARASNQSPTQSTRNLSKTDVAHQSGKRALENYFLGSGMVVEDGVVPSLYRIKYPLPTELPLVSIIIPTRDRVEILKKCIESIQQKTNYKNWEMLIVDNQSIEPETLAYFERIQSDPRIRMLHYSKPFNYSALNNFAVQYARGDVLALLNNDVEVISKDWLSEMVSHAIRPEIGAVGAKLLYSNGTVQHAGLIIGLGGVAGHAHKNLDSDEVGYCYRAVTTQNISAVTGACLVVRKACYQEVGGLNEVNLSVSFNDVDLCLRLTKAGYRNVFTPYALLYHHESISRGHADTTEKHAQLTQEIAYMKNTWGDRLQHDPAYNPNLSLELESFSLSKKRTEVAKSATSEGAEKTQVSPQLECLDADWYLKQSLHVASARNDYPEWIRQFDTLDDKARKAMRTRMDGFSNKPLISVVMPVYNPNPVWLSEAIESVLKQIYPNWELCIADDASTDSAIRPILEKYARQNKRIKVTFREKNGHISAASNSALEIAMGGWIALLDHDDLLAEHALFWVVDAINKYPNSRMIYSDEDKVYEYGGRADPYFKCDWNPDLFYSQNMFSHLGAYHAALVREVGGFRLGLEGSQDYDLALRCMERIAPSQIHHVPRVLYHWRVHVESAASSMDAKPYAAIAGEKAINEHFQRTRVNAKAEVIAQGYRVHYALPNPLPLVSLIIPTRNGLQLLKQCVESILKKTTYRNYEIIIVDNGSDEPAMLKYLERLGSKSRVRVVRDDRPFNYSALNNAAVKLVRGEIVGLINNDMEVINADWLSEMVSIALQPQIGAVSASLWHANQTLRHGGFILGLGASCVAGYAHHRMPKNQYGYFGRAGLINSFSAVTAACLVIKKKIYEEVGGLNETYLKVAFNDVDFCLRVREAGYRNVWTPYAELYHHESATRGEENTPERQARFAGEVAYMKQRWGEQLVNDTAYNPNLTLDHADFSLAWPPRVEILTTLNQ